MNRPFEFRVWDKKNLVFVPEEDFCIYKGNPIQVYTHVGDGYCQKDLATTSNGTGEFVEDDWMVQRFTGLTDSKSQKIFEGDILANFDPMGEKVFSGDVYFSSGAFVLRGVYPLFDLTFSSSPNIVNGYSVIGNINQNPELIS